MRAASAVQVTVQRFGVWNTLLGLISAAAVSVSAAWLVAQHDDLSGWRSMVLIASGVVGLLGVINLARRRPIALRWDTQRWHVADPSRGESDIDVSEMRVVLDLGGWMLLKFCANVPQAGPRSGWIPVQRQGLETHWQSLRCAVYAHRAASMRPTAPDRQAPHG